MWPVLYEAFYETVYLSKTMWQPFQNVVQNIDGELDTSIPYTWPTFSIIMKAKYMKHSMKQ